jgi:hypothetical protein
MARDSTLAYDQNRLNSFGFSMSEITDEMKEAVENVSMNLK